MPRIATQYTAVGLVLLGCPLGIAWGVHLANEKAEEDQAKETDAASSESATLAITGAALLSGPSTRIELSYSQRQDR